MHKKPIFLIFFFILLISVLTSLNTVSADTFEVTEIPTYIDNQLGVGEFIGGLLASIAVLMLTLVPLIILTKGKQAVLYIIVALTVLSPLVGLGWFPIWVFIIIILAIAVGLGRQFSDFLGGLRK